MAPFEAGLSHHTTEDKLSKINAQRFDGTQIRDTMDWKKDWAKELLNLKKTKKIPFGDLYDRLPLLVATFHVL